MALTGVLFSAGRGSRLSPLSDHVPKAVLPMLDVPVGAFGLSQLLTVCSSVVVNVAPQARHIIEADLRTAVGDTLRTEPTMTFLEEFPESFGAAGTLAAVRDRIGERVVTWNADTISDLDLSAMITTHVASGAPATIAAAPVQRNADLSIQGQRATSFVDRRRQPDAGGAQFIGAAVFEKPVLEALSDERPLGLAEAVLEPLVGRAELAVFEHTGYVADVGTFSRYIETSVELLEGRGPRPPLAWPGRIVLVPEGVAYLGPGASAAQGTLGHGAVLLEGSTVEEGASVAHSVVWRKAHVPAGEVVAEAVYPWFRGRAAPSCVR